MPRTPYVALDVYFVIPLTPIEGVCYTAGITMKEQYPQTHTEQEPSHDEGESPKPLFRLGQVVGTPGVLQAFEETGENPLEFLLRHVAGDWGYLCEEDKAENQIAIEQGLRTFSAYKLNNGTKIWVITECDVRRVTVCGIASDFAAGDSPITCDLSLLT